ncbi:hypothetical protein ACIQTZ_00380 [Paenarthrobacter sp. NPDC090520]|uniref:hypothetical protein n=1 Tax=Paenarthrobacter sp. NPDC090520 TaxID=3364382 RepID=UPI00382086FC
MAIAGNLTLVISARIGDAEPSDIGEIELPVVSEKIHTVGNVSITARVRVDEAELADRLKDFAAAVGDELAGTGRPKPKVGPPIQDVIAWAAGGSRIGVFSFDREAAQELVEDFLEALGGDVEVKRVSKVNGRAGIDFSGGGFIRFLATRGTRNNYSFDRIYIPASVNHGEMEALAPLVLTSKEPAVVGYF